MSHGVLFRGPAGGTGLKTGATTGGCVATTGLKTGATRRPDRPTDRCYTGRRTGSEQDVPRPIPYWPADPVPRRIVRDRCSTGLQTGRWETGKSRPVCSLHDRACGSRSPPPAQGLSRRWISTIFLDRVHGGSTLGFRCERHRSRGHRASSAQRPVTRLRTCCVLFHA